MSPTAKLLNIPTVFTLARMLMIPILVIIFYAPIPNKHWLAGFIFALASITDWLDGYLARKLQQTTLFGAFLDPVADKLMVVVALMLIVESHTNPWITIASCIIVAREVAVSALREWMAELGKRASIAVSYVGKAKTLLQMIAITGLLALPTEGYSSALWLSYLLLFISAGLTLWSMIIYLKIAWPNFAQDKKAQNKKP